ncbi:MAG TPA: 6-bladed beta-propeller [Gemmatimonadales bacterium]|nr:6-bladed beta-propeller [Gemmatimonadales bacterium]
MTRRHSALACVLLLPGISALAPPTLGAQQHPDPAYIVREIPAADTVHILSAGREAQPWQEPAPGDAVRFGVLDGAEHEVLGGVDAVVTGPDGKIFILDRRSAVVRVLGADGRYLGRVGRSGRGPGDFFHPGAMAVDAHGFLYVGDLLRRVQRFRPTTRGFELDTVLQTGVSALGLCLIDSLVVLHGVNPGEPGVVHLFDQRGRKLRSFGEVYRSPSRILNHQFSQGKVACLERSRRVAFTPDNGGLVSLRIFDLEGRTRRIVAAPGLQSNIVTEAENEGYSVRLSPDGNHVVTGLLQTPDGRLLLQVALLNARSREEGTPYAELYTAVIDPSGGQPASYSRRTGRIGAFTRGRPVFVVEEPAPAVVWTRAIALP